MLLRCDTARKKSLMWGHFVLGPTATNALCLRCRNVGRFRYELYAPGPIRTEVQNGLMGFCLLTRFIWWVMLGPYAHGFFAVDVTSGALRIELS